MNYFTTTALAGAITLAAGTAFAEDVRVGFVPKFLSDDFQTLMLDL